VSQLPARLAAGRPIREGRALLAALSFLTRIPLGRAVGLGGEDVALAGPAFPLVGAAVGAAVGGSAAALATSLSPLLSAGAALALGVILTGALHLDGLADTADALGARSRTRALEIMRDHAVGAYGTVAIVLDLLCKAAALSALVPHDEVIRFAVAAGALSRLMPVVLACALPYARAAGGAGAALTAGGRPRALAAAAVAVGIAAAVAGLDGLILAGAAALLAPAMALALRRWLGGVTGDVLGASSELAELLLLGIGAALVGAR
jgi:adenosylcobinamide-GDP ribazoletransferase